MYTRVTEAAASYKLSLLSFLGLDNRQTAALCTLEAEPWEIPFCLDVTQNKPAFAAKLPAEQLAEAAADHPEESR